MRKLLTFLSCTLFAMAPFFAEVATASDQTKEDDRLRNCGTVLKEILDVPDNIPQDLLDKADCVVVFPSVLKAAFIVGGSYGRGAMSCRKGEDFRGPWGAPTNGDNRRVYGKKIPAREIVLSGTVAVPPAAEQLISTLDAKTPKHRT